ncbi:hypothetical protein C3L33_00029, partial [Rhododendron williamsianum]
MKTPSFASIDYNLSSPIGCAIINKLQTFCTATHSQQIHYSYRTTILTPQLVQSTLHNCPSDLIALSFFFWCARQPDYFHDRAAFDHMADVVNRLLQRLPTVNRIINQLEGIGCVTKPQTFLLLLRIFWHGGMYNLAFEAFEGMINYGYTPNTYARNIFMDVLFKVGRSDVALQMLKETEDLNFLTFSIAICNLCKLNDLINIRDVLRKMLRKGYYLNAGNCSMVMNCFCKVGRLAEALQLLALMICQGNTISVTVWSILIDGFCKSGELVMAGYLLEKMVEFGCSPNVIVYLRPGAVCKSRQFDLLPILIDGIAIQTDLVVCNYLLSYFCKAGHPAGAVELYNDMIDRGFEPDGYSYAGLLSGLCGTGRIGDALNVYRAIVSNQYCLDPHIHTIILDGLIRSGKFLGAIRLFREAVAEKYPLDVFSYTVAIHGLIRGGRIGEVCSLCSQMKDVGVTPNAYTYKIMLSGFCREKDINMVRQILQEMTDAGIKLDYKAFYQVKNLLLKSRRSCSALYLFVEMCNSELVLDKAMGALLLKGLALRVNVSGNLGGNREVDTSGSMRFLM